MSVFLQAPRWLAKISALTITAGFLVLAGGEILASHSGGPSTFSEWTGILLLIVVSAGMMLAWRWELWGAVLSLTALCVFALVIRMGHYTVLLAIPGWLFLLDWLLQRSAQPPPRA
jgi:hypothetical protein